MMIMVTVRMMVMIDIAVIDDCNYEYGCDCL